MTRRAVTNMSADGLAQRQHLPRGLYELLITADLQEAIDSAADDRHFSLSELESEEIHSAVSQFVEGVVARSLTELRGKDAAERQRRVANKLTDALAREIQNDGSSYLRLAEPLRRLLAIHAPGTSDHEERPDTPLSRSALLTGTRLDPCLGGQLRKEMASADRVDILCSFIKWSGVRLLLDELRGLTAEPLGTGPRLRVITTSYMGATDPRAVETLRDMPNTEVRVSYDTARTRLHAKVYVFHRNTGFGSAYIGSANLSKAALSEGLEWTSKISQYELPHLWEKIVATFETYWNDDEFEPFTAECKPRLQTAIRRERGEFSQGDSTFITLDLRPYPFQEEILEVLLAERDIQQKNRHLIVAATGTGKTMIAAFDYKNFSRGKDRRPSLLFVAHREEILRQALGIFRAVLRDQNFGELLVGGYEPDTTDHLFCSIQSFNSRELWRLPPDQFDYVVVDEFHHAAARSYRRLMEAVNPKLLLGLTATPERSDDLDVFHWFGGEASAEIRLPDAISRRLLSPFQYFGISDSVDLDGLKWQRGGYRVEDLDSVYTGNDVRARLAMDKVHEIVLDASKVRGLGFCVSVAHAEFMARFFTDHGIPAIALSSGSNDEERRSAQDRLRRREVNFIFIVDLYNEGVDIPEVDTILFLRPTESLTVYLQQFGRGLRLHDEKECLTVLDFIGAQRREFRFASRFRALSTEPTRTLDGEVEQGFPHLPPGCFVRLERVAQQRVLQNIRESLSLRRPRVVAELKELGRHLERRPTIPEALEYLDADLDDLLKRGLWTRLLVDAGLADTFDDPDEAQLAKGIRRLAHIDDPVQIRFLADHLETPKLLTELSELEVRRLNMLHVTLWGAVGKGWTLADAEGRLRSNYCAVSDLRSILAHRIAHTHTRPAMDLATHSGPLSVHAQYTRDEILAGLKHWTVESRPDFREGVLHLAGAKVDAFFITLHKTEDSYSPTTMYEDYVISHDLFHWQSQSTTSVESATGQRYIRHGDLGYTPLLFVREYKRMPSGLAAPYAFLGPAEYVSHEGSRPISIVWRLKHQIPARLLRPIARQAAG